VTLTVERGAEFVPELIRGLSAQVGSVSITRPSLNDVFLSLTGKSIRDEEADAYGPLRDMARAHRRGLKR